MTTVDFFAVRLPHLGGLIVGACAGCGVAVVDDCAGTSFVCSACAQTHCGWCGRLRSEHIGPFTTPQPVGNREYYNLPDGQCPNFELAVCQDCWRQVRPGEQVILCQAGIVHAHTCAPEQFDYNQLPLLSEQTHEWRMLHDLLHAVDPGNAERAISQLVGTWERPWTRLVKRKDVE